MSTKETTSAPQVSAQQPVRRRVPAVLPEAGTAQRLGNQHLRTLLGARLLQAKLTVSHPQDAFEQEADRVADHVMRVPGVPVVQRLEDSATEVPSVDAATEHSIGALSGRGRALPESVRSFMEPRFNSDFGAVRVHTDAHADGLARAVSARAFTVGRNIVFGAGHYAPGTENGRRLIAHELTHVVQQTKPGAPHATETIQREVDSAAVDAWNTMSAAGRKRAQALYEECMELIGRLGDAQTAHVSILRSKWIKFLSTNVLVRINELDSDSKIDGLANVLHDFSDRISRYVANSFAEWEAVEHRYVDEHDWLARRSFDDAGRGASHLEGLHTEAKRWLDAGAAAYITEEDFSHLKLTLERGSHIAVGTLQASRARARKLQELLDVVTELRVSGEDADKIVPGWAAQVQNEADNLAHLAARTRPTPGTDYPEEFSRLRIDLLARRDATVRAHKPERTFSEKAVLLVAGVAEGLAAPFVETARELLDLTQGALMYVSGGRYLPKFTSDLMKAFEQGATRTDILKGLVGGLLGTPGRFVNAIRDGNWESVGTEAVNLYYLIKVAERSPESLEKLPELLATTKHGLRILRARVLGLELGEARLLPREPLPSEPTYLPPHREVGGFGRESQTVLGNQRTSPRVGGLARTSEAAGWGSDVPPVPLERPRQVGGFARPTEPPVPFDPNAVTWPTQTRVGGLGRPGEKTWVPLGEPQTLVPPPKPVPGFRPHSGPKKSAKPLKEIPVDAEIPEDGDFVIQFRP
jgi:hypothetical protein